VKSIKSLSWIRGLLGLEAVAIPPQVFALDATSASFGAFARSPSGIELREFHRVSLTPETFGEGLVGCDLREERSLREGLDELLGRMEAPVTEAALVLPDAWLRIAFAETAELPRSASERDEVLRWKLKRLVPFRVDDLRLESMEVEVLADQEEPRRLMLGFAAEALLGHLEAMFSSYGIRLGLVTNVSLALVQAVVEREGDGGLIGVVSVDREGYVLAFARAGRPVMHRYKANEGGRDGADPAKALRELKLTRAFLAERLPGERVETVHLHAPGELESQWAERLEEGLGAKVRMATELADWPGAQDADDLRGPVPLMGAACTRV
jgi:hypothetical protein